ncbi:MAG: hypothetical protein AMJ90_02385 [candidate division Zixibacteria bacterium SM23_73_2]|nr:MAG: hypothetical protein AMJ90_02385 [candidate division Zixibacteria bacterium SM23_73_2]
MSMFKVVSVILLMIFPFSVTAQTLPAAEKKEFASQSISNSMRGKHGTALNAGILGGVTVANEVSVGGVTNSVEERGFLGSIAYTYWIENDLAVNFSLGLFSMDVTNSVQGSEVSTETATVVPLLFGVKYQPFKLTDSDVLRPYVLASVGPFFGSATINRVGANIVESESYSETALGSRLAVGIDLSLSKLFTLGAGAGYYLVTDFKKRIGSEKNYSSPEFSLSFGIVFGRGKK